jgi:hypothetical protein
MAFRPNATAILMKTQRNRWKPQKKLPKLAVIAVESHRLGGWGRGPSVVLGAREHPDRHKLGARRQTPTIAARRCPVGALSSPAAPARKDTNATIVTKRSTIADVELLQRRAIERVEQELHATLVAKMILDPRVDFFQVLQIFKIAAAHKQIVDLLQVIAVAIDLALLDVNVPNFTIPFHADHIPLII